MSKRDKINNDQSNSDWLYEGLNEPERISMPSIQSIKTIFDAHPEAAEKFFESGNPVKVVQVGETFGAYYKPEGVKVEIKRRYPRNLDFGLFIGSDDLKKFNISKANHKTNWPACVELLQKDGTKLIAEGNFTRDGGIFIPHMNIPRMRIPGRRRKMKITCTAVTIKQELFLKPLF